MVPRRLDGQPSPATMGGEGKGGREAKGEKRKQLGQRRRAERAMENKNDKVKQEEREANTDEDALEQVDGAGDDGRWSPSSLETNRNSFTPSIFLLAPGAGV